MNTASLIDGVNVDVCPICESKRIDYYKTVPDITRRRWDASREYPNLVVYYCRDCGVVFLNPQPSLVVGSEYYTEVYGGQDNSQHDYYRDEFKVEVARKRVQQLEAIVGYKGKMLDVGAGRGHFINAASREGWNGFALEASAEGCNYARNQYGLENIVQGYLPHRGLSSDFDVVTMWDVIEHMTDPMEALGETWKLIKPGGYLVIRTGNIGSWTFDRNRENWWAWFCDHRFYFSAHTLSRALTKANFSVIRIDDLESVERPEKAIQKDISETSVGDGIITLLKSPTKFFKVGSYIQNKFRHYRGSRTHGHSYLISIMTLIARKSS